MFRRIRNMQDVVDWGLCIGCGACAAVCDRNAVTLINVTTVGIRPRFEHAACSACNQCLAFCPGYQVDARPLAAEATAAGDGLPDAGFGETLEIWEGYASDPQIRHQASSGGILTALALYCLEREGMSRVAHVGGRADQPWLNETVLSAGRAELLARTGSRYAPASPAEALREIARSEKPCVFIGKPCDAAAVAALRAQRPALNEKIGLLLTFFCAGTPSTQGSLALLERLGVAPENLQSLRYRGEGWPGGFKARTRAGDEQFVSYKESWHELQKYRPFRCQLCPDGLGRLGDVACGDAWEKYSDEGTGGDCEGRSLVLARTRRGREIVRRAIAGGYVTLERAGAENVLEAQPNLLGKRVWLWGRLLGMSILGVPAPRYLGFDLYRAWKELPLKTKLKTILGTSRRIVQRGMYRRRGLFGER